MQSPPVYKKITHKVYHKRVLVITFYYLLFGVSLLFTVGCSKNVENTGIDNHEWQYADLRAIDPVDAIFTSADIVALYVSEDSHVFRARLDLLELNVSDQYDIFIGFDYQPSSSEKIYYGNGKTFASKISWDMYLVIPSMGEIWGQNAQGQSVKGIKARVFRDTLLDTLTISIEKHGVLPDKAPITLEVLLVDISTERVLDRVDPISSRSVPPNPARVIIGFCLSKQAYSPAHVLRMWDGAHTGPMSDRHGLRYLFEAAEDNEISFGFVGLESPFFVGTVSFLGVYPWVRELLDREIIYNVYDDVFCLGGDGDNGYAKFSQRQTLAQLSLETRNQLVNAALNAGVLILGGDFFVSEWGNPEFVANIFNYIKSHPWIRVLKGSDLKKFSNTLKPIPIRNREFLPGIDPDTFNDFNRLYDSTPDNTLKALARQTYSLLSALTYPLVDGIKENYFWMLGHMLSASAWYDDPNSISTCDFDIDWDGEKECILSSDKTFLTIEIAGGYLAFGFYLDDHGVHQMVAPYSEVVIGFGDPTTYDKQNGIYADPANIPGLLANISEDEQIFRYKITSDTIELSNDNLRVSKSFQIIENGIRIKWHSDRDVKYVLPFTIDPWLRLNPNWSDPYFTEPGDSTWVLGIRDQTAIRIKSLSDGRFDSFLDSRPYIGQPEDPNFEYPQGHYLPFPFAVLSLSPSNSGLIEVEIYNP